MSLCFHVTSNSSSRLFPFGLVHHCPLFCYFTAPSVPSCSWSSHEFFFSIDVNSLHLGRAMTLAVSRLPGQPMWDLWWTKWHWDRFFPPSTSVFPCESFHRFSTACKRTKNNHLHLHYRVAQEALRLRCAHSVCCGALLHFKRHSIYPTIVISVLEEQGTQVASRLTWAQTTHREGEKAPISGGGHTLCVNSTVSL
jgi:hypothetical protein